MLNPKSFLLPVFLLLCGMVHAQSKIQYKAEGRQQFFRKDGKGIRILVDKVVFTQESTRVNCDSAVFYGDENRMEAYGNIRIVDNTTTITAHRLTYEGDRRMALLRKDVRYQEGKRRMVTESLDYDLDNEIAIYKEGGKLLDSVNTLTSKTGFFYSKQNYAVFYSNVVLVSPDYTLKTDTLRYNTSTKIAHSDGSTEIITDDNTTLYSEGGIFRTYVDQSQFVEGNVTTTDYFLEGDQLFFDDLRKYYKAEGNVKLIAKEKDVIIIGDEGFYDKENELSKIYGNPIMKRVLREDTFYLAADTLIAIDSEVDSLKRILAYNNIRIFKQNLQGRADSAAYFMEDSLIYMYFDPVLWANESQISADTIILEVTENSIKQMDLIQRSFLISQDTLKNFNQVKGRNMTGYFTGRALTSISVDGNGETIFYVLDEGDSTLLGMNRLICSNMRIGFENNDIATIQVYKEPEGKIIPPHELTMADERLRGFQWRLEERPTLTDIFSGRKPGRPARKQGPKPLPKEHGLEIPVSVKGTPGRRPDGD